MTLNRIINILELLNEKGYTLTQAVEILKRIAKKSD